MDFEKLPPHSIDAEMCLLASIMLDKEVAGEVIPRLAADSFYQPDHQVIFKAIFDLHKARKPVDAILLREELIKRNRYDEIGGRDYIAAILNAVPSAAHGNHYAGVVREKAALREIIKVATLALSAAYVGSDDASQIAADMTRKFSMIATTGQSDPVHRIGDVVREIYNERDLGFTGFRSGIASIDEAVGGFVKGEMLIVGAAPGTGKSAICKQIAQHNAAEGVAVGYISIEEGRKKIAAGAVSHWTGIPNHRIRKRTADADDWNRVGEAVGHFETMPFFVVDSAMTLQAITAAARCFRRDHACEIIVVDHIHLIQTNERETREQQISDLSNGLKLLFRELDVAGIVVAQLNRRNERPTIESLRGSGTLGQDGDVIILLHADDVTRASEKGYTPDGKLEALIVKSKDGPMGQVPLQYDRARFRITDWPGPVAPQERLTPEQIFD